MQSADWLDALFVSSTVFVLGFLSFNWRFAYQLIRYYLSRNKYVAQHNMKEEWDTRHSPGGCDMCKGKNHDVINEMSQNGNHR